MTGVHVLIFPYPAQGHMLPLLDFAHQLASRGVTITILVTPKNLHLLNALLSVHPSIGTLVLPFPANQNLPAGVENVKELPPDGFRHMMRNLRELRGEIVEWFRRHPSPPTAIVSDLFLGFTNDVAAEVGVRRYVFSSSGAFALSVIYSLWRELPKRKNPNDDGEVLRFPDIPSCPEFPWWQISPVYRSYADGDQNDEFFRECFLANILSYGLVCNSFTELERVYFKHLMEYLGHDRIWAVGPLLPLEKGQAERGGLSSISSSDIISWLDSCQDNSVVYVCFGSQSILTNQQMEAIALGLEKSGVRFIWSTRGPTKGHVEEGYNSVPPGFEDRVAGRGMVIKGWAPQVLILQHRAVGAFLSHCGWNSTLEGIVAGVPLLTWPMGADQYTNAILIADEHRIGTRASEGDETVPNSDELAQILIDSLSQEGKGVEQRERALHLRQTAMDSVNKGGDSFNNLEDFVMHLFEEASKM
nr:UDP-glycosyltransferase 89B2-like [Ipomoea batatas]